MSVWMAKPMPLQLARTVLFDDDGMEAKIIDAHATILFGNIH